MFKFHRAISAQSYSSEELFKLISQNANKLATLLSLSEPLIEPNEDSLSISILAKNFVGRVAIVENEIEIHGDFKEILKFDKTDVNKKLDIWVQDIFHNVYD